jgi:hypothetical protein
LCGYLVEQARARGLTVQTRPIVRFKTLYGEIEVESPWADANWLSIGPIYRSKKILHFVPTHDPHKVIFSIVTIRVLRSNVFRYPPLVEPDLEHGSHGTPSQYVLLRTLSQVLGKQSSQNV